MAGIMDFFKSAQADSNTNPSPNSADGGQPSSNDPSKDGKQNLSDQPATANKDGKMPGSNETPENPLDVYSKMFENAAKNSGVQAPEFSLDPKVVNEVSSKLDFTKELPPELMEKALTGDVKALLGVIQATTQNAYKAALQHGTALTDTFVKQRSEYDKKSMQDGVRSGLTQQALSDAPNFNHPVIRQELNRVAEQFARANPDASPQEIAKSAKQYITDLSTALNPKAKTPQEEEGKMDWGKYLDS
jgi:hypothetical protein